MSLLVVVSNEYLFLLNRNLIMFNLLLTSSSRRSILWEFMVSFVASEIALAKLIGLKSSVFLPVDKSATINSLLPFMVLS